MRIVDSMAFWLATGSAPGSARQVGQTCVLGGAPKVVLQPQNIFDLVPSSTCVSRPSTGSKRSSASSYGMSVPAVMVRSSVSARCVSRQLRCLGQQAAAPAALQRLLHGRADAVAAVV